LPKEKRNKQQRNERREHCSQEAGEGSPANAKKKKTGTQDLEHILLLTGIEKKSRITEANKEKETGCAIQAKANRRGKP